MENNLPFSEIHYKDLCFMRAPTIKCTHGFSTRFGGVSEGALESLNLGENRGDAEENVRENYRLFLKAVGVPFQDLCYTRQVHKNEVRVVTSEDRRELFSPFHYEADGIVTNETSLPLICYTADCVPVLLCDHKAGVIGAVHCGWRSTVSDILAVAVKKMINLGASPKDIAVGIGPAIDMCCYETSADVPRGIDELLGEDASSFYFPLGDSGKFMVDLKQVNRYRLLTLGLRDKNISVSDECTSCNDHRYWSHRKTNGERGTQAAIIML